MLCDVLSFHERFGGAVKECFPEELHICVTGSQSAHCGVKIVTEDYLLA